MSSTTDAKSTTDPPAVVWLCVGGCWFATTRDTLAKYRKSNLFHVKDGDFVDRDPATFRYVLNYLRGSKVMPECAETLAELEVEADYYNLTELIETVRDARRTAPRSLARSAHIICGRTFA